MEQDQSHVHKRCTEKRAAKHGKALASTKESAAAVLVWFLGGVESGSS